MTVPLKTAKEDRRRTERTTYQESDFSGKRVLLVEDNEINIEITRNILIHKNFMVDIAENGKAGVEQFLKHEPGYYDVILMDAAPSYVFSDAMILSSYADKVLYVVRVDKADAKEIRVGMNSFEEKEKLIGYVINRDTGGYISQSGYGYGRYGKYQKYRKYAELDEETMNTEDTL